MAHRPGAGRSADGSRSVVSQSTAPAADSDWPRYRRDAAGTGYSPLAEINAANVGRLSRAWTYSLEADAAAPPAGGAAGVNSQATPIVVRGVMYVPAANRVVALDPATGRETWRHDVTGGAPSRRGVAYWPGDNERAPRLLFTSGRRLLAINAATARA